MDELETDRPSLCDRCLRELVGGRGEFYEIEIHARVDSSPPIFDTPKSLDREAMDEQWGKVIKQLESTPQVDAESQVHCRRRILLCSPCFQLWIENPAGGD